jgi:protocatechuate 3,4-dioxygenase beta subunit
VPSGRYRFFATHAGYVDQRYKSSGPDTEGAILSLQPGQEINDALFRMVLAAVITGRISDEDGEPMPNMQVVALQRPSEDEREENPWIGKQEVKPIASVQTDDRGQYRLFGLKAGEYYVRAVDEMAPSFIGGFEQDSVAARDSLGSQYAPVYYPGVTQLGQAQTVPLTAGEEAQVDFVIRRMKMVDVSGRVIAADGKPCTNAFVILEEAQGASEMGHVQRTDNKGEFKLRGVPPGSYILTAQVDEGGDIPRFNARQKIEVGGENIGVVPRARQYHNGSSYRERPRTYEFRAAVCLLVFCGCRCATRRLRSRKKGRYFHDP